MVEIIAKTKVRANEVQRMLNHICEKWESFRELDLPRHPTRCRVDFNSFLSSVIVSASLHGALDWATGISSRVTFSYV
jgi:hypothetical protein